MQAIPEVTTVVKTVPKAQPRRGAHGGACGASGRGSFRDFYLVLVLVAGLRPALSHNTLRLSGHQKKYDSLLPAR